jgi:MSHA biogenesis protein MshO
MRPGSDTGCRHAAGAAARATRGYTLIELVAVMSITAVVAAMTAVFIRLPLQIYQDVQRRASISDAADTAFGFMKRDLQTALPNSVRVAAIGSVYYIELLQARAGARYRADLPSAPVATGANTCPDVDVDGTANENVLQFGVAETCLTTLGTVANLASIAANADFLAVYNLGTGFSNADAYASGAVTGGNKSLITSAAAGQGGENVIRFQSNTFNLESPARRFHVVSGPVSYVCDPAAGTLRRISAYSIAAVQPKPPAGSSVVLADGITGCTVTYDQNVVNQRNGIVSIWLRFSDPAGGTTQNLFQQIQVSNDP